MKIILASQSERRKKLLDLMKLEYSVMPSNVDESFEEGLSISEQSKRLAYIKAKEIFNNTSGDRIVIGSDTMVIKEKEVLGKPKDRNDAIRMINLLKNDVHQVITSLCVLIQDGEKFKQYIDYDIVNVYLKNMSDSEISKWIDEGNVFDKAGAYAIQSEFGVFVEKIEGNNSTVIGLPIHKLYDVIKEYIN